KLDTLEERPVRSSLDLPPDQTSTHSPSPSSLGKVQREAGPIGSDDPASEAKEEVGPRLDEIAESVAVGASIVPELAKPVEISDLLPPAGVPTEADNEYADVKAGSNV